MKNYGKEARIFIRIQKQKKDNWKKLCSEKQISLNSLIINSVEKRIFDNERRKIKQQKQPTLKNLWEANPRSDQMRDIIFVKTWSSIRSSFMLQMKPDQLKNDDDKGLLNLLFEKRIEVGRSLLQLTGFSLVLEKSTRLQQ